MVTARLFKKGVNAQKIDLAKIGWTESKDDNKIFSYIRGYIWRNYGVRIKPPLDFVICCMLDDILSQEADRCKEVSADSSHD